MSKNWIIWLTMLMIVNFTAHSQIINRWVQDISPDANLQFQNGRIIFTEFGSPARSFETDFTENITNNILFVDFDFRFRFEYADYMNQYFEQGSQR